jgi:hypothetical protein
MHLSFDILFLDSTYRIQGLAHARQVLYHFATPPNPDSLFKSQKLFSLEWKPSLQTGKAEW